MNELSGVKILKSGNRQPKKGKCPLKADENVSKQRERTQITQIKKW